MKTNRGFIQILGPILVLIAILGGGYIYYQQNYAKPVNNTPVVDSGSSSENTFDTNYQPPKPIGGTYVKPTTPTQPVACTQEAKICPDGSAVSRTGPKCEFAACPNISATTTVVTAYIKFIEGNKITLDYIEILYGDEAKKALVADGKCTLDEITNNRCGYLYNGNHYDRNQNPLLRTFTVSADAKVTTATAFKRDPSGIITISFQEFSKDYLPKNYDGKRWWPPSEITLNSNNEVVKIKEIFRP